MSPSCFLSTIQAAESEMAFRTFSRAYLCSFPTNRALPKYHSRSESSLWPWCSIICCLTPAGWHTQSENAGMYSSSCKINGRKIQAGAEFNPEAEMSGGFKPGTFKREAAWRRFLMLYFVDMSCCRRQRTEVWFLEKKKKKEFRVCDGSPGLSNCHKLLCDHDNKSPQTMLFLQQRAEIREQHCADTEVSFFYQYCAH